MSIESYGLTHVGRRRQHNEDYHLVDPQLGIFIVCDGMGGHAAGEVASELAATVAHRVLQRDHHEVRELLQHDTPELRERVRALVESAVHAACLEVFQAGQDDPNKMGMGTTLELLLVAGNVGFMGHVGDSRLYLKRGTTVHQLSEDHTYANELVRAGKMSPEQALHAPQGHVLTRAIGTHATVKVDTLVFDIAPGDTFLLCSDGLSGYFEDPTELGERLDDRPLEDIAKSLIDACNERGGKDNITAVLVRERGNPADRRQDTHRAEDIALKLDVLRQVHLFKHLTYKELVDVMSVSRSLRVEARHTLIREGAKEEEFYVVVEGEVEVSRQSHVITTLTRGAHFGEMELVARRPRSASVRALANSHLLVFTRADFFALIRNNQSVAVKLLWGFVQTLSSRLHHANQQLPHQDESDSLPF